ncbi:hypothetical protein ACHMWN_04290 [Pedobacter sp. UC225_61]|uniref:hypothetical protein n=1 Tax=Pedobacter sp. UC225_61 TaxID=3374623 RepID=UPI00378E6FFB
MHKKEQSLQKHLNDALIEISDSHPSHSLELLAANGVNTSALMKNSLEKIKGYNITLSKSAAADEKKKRIATLKNKINEYLMINPERTKRVLNTCLKGNFKVQFQSSKKLDTALLENLDEHVTIEDLIQRLDSENESE